MIERGQGKEGGRVLFGAGNVEVMGRLGESSSNDMIETETNKPWIEEHLGMSEGQRLSEVFLLRKKSEKSMAGAVGSEEMCSYMLIVEAILAHL